MNSHRVIYWLGLGLLGGIYVAAGAIKIVDPKAFARAILEYRLMPENLVPALAVLLPWWECVAGVMAIAGWFRRGALLVLAGLSAAFTTAGAITLSRGLSPECGCFGGLSERVGLGSVAFELLLTAIALMLLWRQNDDILRANIQK